ncbi:hypothetical protein NFI96_004148 [Prochilodus magdalenae]|nr:hypothetical protein NFI96_004148 [Prochilodus magdalenae]
MEAYGSTSSGKIPAYREFPSELCQGRHPPNLDQLGSSLMEESLNTDVATSRHLSSTGPTQSQLLVVLVEVLQAAIVENMAEFRPGLCTEAAQQGLMQWLLKRIKAKMPFDANKLYCSEILAILLQNNDGTRDLLGELDGIDVLLQQLSVVCFLTFDETNVNNINTINACTEALFTQQGRAARIRCLNSSRS